MEDKQYALGSNADQVFEPVAVHVNNGSTDHGWHKVSYAKRQRKPIKSSPAASGSNKIVSNGAVSNGDNVFRSLEQQAEDRRRRIVEAQKVADVYDGIYPVKSQIRSDDEGAEDSDEESSAINGKAEEVKKVKPKKVKKPKVTVAEAADKIDADDLSAFLAEVSVLYETQPDIQLMRFADYFGRAFSAVSASQFPWLKIFKESTVDKLIDIPLTHLSEAVYKTSVEWLNKCSLEALSSFILWSLDSIFIDLASQQSNAKGPKKGVKQVSSKSQVAIFAVVAMVFRRKPDVLINLLPTLRENAKYQGHDKLLVTVWMSAQASQGDLAVGLCAWANYFLPMVCGKTCNPQSRDLVLQLVERILSIPKSRPIFINSAVRKGVRLIPPSAFETLMRVTYPVASSRVKATERFETIYPTLKEVALAGSSGSKAMKQVSQQIFHFTIQAAGENIPELSREATDLAIWCFTQNMDCCKQWDQVYEDNIEASLMILKKLRAEWKEISVKLVPLDPLRETVKNFRLKNEKASASGADAPHHKTFQEAEKHAKVIQGRLSRGSGCMKSVALTVFAVAMGAAVLSTNMESWDLKKLSFVFSPQQSF